MQQAYETYQSVLKRIRVLIDRLETVVMDNLDGGGKQQVHNETLAEDRTLILYVMLIAQVATLGILFFWAMGALLQLTQNGGHINSLQLDTIGPGFLHFGLFCTPGRPAGWPAGRPGARPNFLYAQPAGQGTT